MLLIRRVHLSAPPFANRLLRINRSLSTKSSASTAHELSPVMVNVEESADTHTFHTIGEAIPTNQLGNVPFIAIPRPGQPSRVETLIANLNKKLDDLNDKYNNLQTSHAKLQTSHAKLQASHAKLQASHANLMTKMDKNDSILACVELLKIGQFQSIFKAFKDTAYYSRSGLVHRAKDFKHLESHVAGLRRLKEPSDDQKAFLAIFTKDFEPKFRWALKHSHSTLHDLVHRRNSLAHPTTVSPERLAYLISVLEHPHLRNLSKEFIPFVTGNIVLNPIDNDNENEFDDN